MNEDEWTVRDCARFIVWSNSAAMRLVAAKFRLKELFRTMSQGTPHITYNGTDELP